MEDVLPLLNNGRRDIIFSIDIFLSSGDSRSESSKLE